VRELRSRTNRSYFVISLRNCVYHLFALPNGKHSLYLVAL